jgi:predicted aspartyl protease
VSSGYDAYVTRLALALAVLATLTPLPAAAEIFRYTDANGRSYYVDGIDSVPQEFRARAVPMGLRNAPPGTTPEPTTVERVAAGATVPKGGTAIKYTPGQPIMVDVKINGGTSAKLLLDTGADGTMINPRVLVAAGASLSRPVGTSRVTGVTGSDSVSFVFIDSLEIGEARVGRMRVASYDVPSAGDGLLGRDFLDRFSVNIDSTNGIVTLSPK